MRRYRFFILLLLLFLCACQLSEEERIRQTLNQRGEAFKKKDLSLYLSCISKDYQDRNGDFSQLQKRMEAYFETFDRIEYDYWDRSLQMEGEMVTVIQQFRVEVEKRGKKDRHSGKEALLMRKEGKQWKIVKGL
ncbi:MAG TPA: nuclear transport factor 2 family protein [Thermodesulfobacteriota bacterium]|nr:nuclear transport factor 2 family protein [Thermodesulfobacteriota bacterium]